MTGDPGPTGAVGPGRLAELAQRFGTPLYVYDLAHARAAHADLRAALPAGSELFYSLKANPHRALVAALIGAGARAEVCSSRELAVAWSTGAEPATFLYSGPGKTGAELDDALAAGVGTFSVDSPVDIARLGAHARRAGRRVRAVLRLNPSEYPRGAGLAMGGSASQFGADVSWVRERPELFAADGVDVVGYHVYVGTNVSDPADLLAWFRLGLDAVAAADEALRTPLRLVDLGGGFGHPYSAPGERPDLSGLRQPLTALLDERLPGRRDGRTTVAFESGRYLAAGAGHLVVRVQDVKHSKGTRFVVVDGGVNVLGGMSGLRRVPPLRAGVLSVGPAPGPAPTDPGATGGASGPVGPVGPDAGDTPATVAGPLCTALDLLGHGVPLPDLAPGALLAVPNVGAYGLSASLLGFLSRDAPVEVAVDGRDIASATRPRLVHEPVTTLPTPPGPSGAELRPATTEPAATTRTGMAS